MFERRNLLVKSPVYLNAPRSVQSEEYDYESFAEYKRVLWKIIFVLLMLFVFSAITAYFLMRTLLHEETTLNCLCALFVAVMFAGMQLMWIDILQHGIKERNILYVKRLQHFLEYDDAEFYGASVTELYRASQEKLKPIAQLIKELQAKMSKLPESEAEKISLEITTQRELLGAQFDIVKQAGVFPEEMGYATLFDIGPRPALVEVISS